MNQNHKRKGTKRKNKRERSEAELMKRLEHKKYKN